MLDLSKPNQLWMTQEILIKEVCTLIIMQSSVWFVIVLRCTSFAIVLNFTRPTGTSFTNLKLNLPKTVLAKTGDISFKTENMLNFLMLDSVPSFMKLFLQFRIGTIMPNNASSYQVVHLQRKSV